MFHAEVIAILLDKDPDLRRKFPLALAISSPALDADRDFCACAMPLELKLNLIYILFFQWYPAWITDLHSFVSVNFVLIVIHYLKISGAFVCSSSSYAYLFTYIYLMYQQPQHALFCQWIDHNKSYRFRRQYASSTSQLSSFPERFIIPCNAIVKHTMQFRNNKKHSDIFNANFFHN